MLENVLLFEDERRQGRRHHHPADANLHRRGLRAGRPARARKRGARGQGTKAEFTTIEPGLHDVSTCFKPRWLLFIVKACYRPPPTQKRAPEAGDPVGRGDFSPLVRKASPQGPARNCDYAEWARAGDS